VNNGVHGSRTGVSILDKVIGGTMHGIRTLRSVTTGRDPVLKGGLDSVFRCLVWNLLISSQR